MQILQILENICMPPPKKSAPHHSFTRLLELARRATASDPAPVITDLDLRHRLGVSAGTFSNWKSRGISREGAFKAEAALGINATHVRTGRALDAAAKAVLLPPSQLAFTASTSYRSAVDEAGAALAGMLGAPGRLALIRLMSLLLKEPAATGTIDISQVIQWCSGPLPPQSQTLQIPDSISQSLQTQLDAIGATNLDIRGGDADRNGETDQLGERPRGQRRSASSGD